MRKLFRLARRLIDGADPHAAAIRGWRRQRLLGRLRWRPVTSPDGNLTSHLCSQEDLESDTYARWFDRLGIDRHIARTPAGVPVPGRMHRKWWEWMFIAQAVHERGLLGSGARGLGFAVGREPLSAFFASYGCPITATDLPSGDATQVAWHGTSQHADSLAGMNDLDLCPDDLFRRKVEFRPVDMNAIPSDLTGYDFCWSSCSFEHLGSIAKGLAFVENSLKCLRPGGVAIHTTELNLSSNRRTIDHQDTVLFRRRDLEELARRLRSAGHGITLDLSEGTRPAELHVDVEPYRQDPHLRLLLQGFVSTSVGLIVTKGGLSAPRP